MQNSLSQIGKRPLTSNQAKARLKEAGITIKDWAISNNYPIPEVYRVLNGVTKGRYGRAHEIAVKLGMKVAA